MIFCQLCCCWKIICTDVRINSNNEPPPHHLLWFVRGDRCVYQRVRVDE